MKDILFWTLLIVILFSIFYVSQTCLDTFVAAPPPPVTLETGDPTGYAPPSFTLLAPPSGGVASVNTLPYMDPAQEKAPLNRIKEVLVSAQGFLTVEAPKMSEMSDPSIQLPLTTLRADVNRLTDEQMVLDRNPGIQSTLTQNDVDGMQANLAYLQKKWRSVEDSGSGNVEGFTDASGNKVTATVDELKDLVVKLDVEITRLSASATTDPVTKKRIQVLTNIKRAVNDVVDDVKKGLIREADIPISQDAYVAFLPVIGTSSPLPQLFGANLPPSLWSLFPATGVADASGADMTRYLFNKYADTLVKGLSWDVNLNYISERKANTATASSLASLLSAQGITVPYGDQSAQLTTHVQGATVTPTSADSAATVTSSGSSGSSGSSTRGTSSRLDWKDRSSVICSAIQKRGYNPGDFGCLTDTTSVGEDFSWRGYARMVCTRVSTIYDTGAPEAVGCPPLTWPGWRS